MINSVLLMYVCSGCFAEQEIPHVHEECQEITNEWNNVDQDGYPADYTFCLVIWNGVEIQAIWSGQFNLWYRPYADLCIDPSEVKYYFVLRRNI